MTCIIKHMAENLVILPRIRRGESLTAVREEIKTDVDFDFAFLFNNDPVGYQQEKLFSLEEIGNETTKLGKVILSLNIAKNKSQILNSTPESKEEKSSKTYDKVPAFDENESSVSVSQVSKNQKLEPLILKMAPMKPWLVKGVKIFSKDELLTKTKYRTFHNEEAKRLCKTNLSARQIYEEINKKWKEKKSIDLNESPLMQSNRKKVQEIEAKIEHLNKKGENVSALKSKLRKAKDALRKSCDRELKKSSTTS